MTTDAFTTAARAEADARVSQWNDERNRRRYRMTFEEGATWARAHLAAQEPQVTIHHEEGKPATCEVRRGGVLVFAGRDHSADLRVAAQEPTDAGQISDGYHTFDELYEYRMLYNAHAATAWTLAGIPVVKSWRHADGELCFGGGWFIVTAELPSGQVSNHYAAEHWGLFRVPEAEMPPAYDGHTPQEAAARLRAALTAAKEDRS